MKAYGKKPALLAGVLLAAYNLPANATLIGDEVSCSVTAPWVCSPNTPTTVAAGAEFDLLAATGGFDVDIGATSISITEDFASNFAIGSTVLELTDLDLGLGITGIDNFYSDLLSITAASVIVGVDSISIDLAGTWRDGYSISFDLLYTADNSTDGGGGGLPTTTVPEPGTLSLLGAGLLCLGLGGRRRRRTASRS